MARITRGGGWFGRVLDMTRGRWNLNRRGGVVAIAGFESLGLWIERLGRIVSAVEPMGVAREPLARHFLF